MVVVVDVVVVVAAEDVEVTPEETEVTLDEEVTLAEVLVLGEVAFFWVVGVLAAALLSVGAGSFVLSDELVTRELFFPVRRERRAIGRLGPAANLREEMPSQEQTCEDRQVFEYFDLTRTTDRD